MTRPHGVADARDGIDGAPMSRAQITGVVLIALLSALDGYDVLAMTFAAPSIARAWDLDKGSLGLALSSGLVGMALGSFTLAPLADRLGRRALVIVNLLLMLSGMLFAAFAANLVQLAGWRLLTGIGIGGMVPIITPLAAEFANARRRTLAVAAIAVGYPLGGTIGGFAAALLLYRFDWPSVFLLGACATIVLLPVILLWLPESPAFLATRTGPDALGRLNRLRARFGQPALDVMPPRRREAPRASYRAIFARGQAGATVMITLVNLLFVMTVYYVLSWLPQMVADIGRTPAFATTVSALAAFVGSLACVLIGLFASAVPHRVIVPIHMIGLGVATAIFGFVPGTTAMLLASAAVLGIFLYGGILGLYGMIVDAFVPEVRATGAGFVMGIGRAGAAIAPALAGFLFAEGASRGLVSIALAAGALMAGLIVLGGRVIHPR